MDEEVKTVDVLAFTPKFLQKINPMFVQNNRIAINLCKETSNVSRRVYRCFKLFQIDEIDK